MLKPEAFKIHYIIGPIFGHDFICSPPILPPVIVALHPTEELLEIMPDASEFYIELNGCSSVGMNDYIDCGDEGYIYLSKQEQINISFSLYTQLLKLLSGE